MEEVTSDPQFDFDKVFSTTMSTKLPYSESEQSRIDLAFKRQDSQAELKTHSSDSELKTSSSIHGISNPNYGHSPTARWNTLLFKVKTVILKSIYSLESLQFGNYTPPGGSEPYRPYTSAYNMTGGKKQGIKKASLFASMTLQSVPEETIISPHILEFLEQTLEPIPAKAMTTTGIQT